MAYGSDAEMTINGGTFTNSTIWLRNYNDDEYNPKLSINGGTFSFNNSYNFVFGNPICCTKQNEVLSITGGTFSSDPSDYVAGGYEAVQDSTKNEWAVVEKK